MIQSVTRVVFPNPAGADISVRRPLNPELSFAINFGRGISDGRFLGVLSLVASRWENIALIISEKYLHLNRDDGRPGSGW